MCNSADKINEACKKFVNRELKNIDDSEINTFLTKYTSE
jgi:hypothetical protein